MIGLLAAAMLVQNPPPFAASMGYVLTIATDPDGRGASLTLSGQTLGADGLAKAWSIHLGYVPKAARITGRGRTVILGNAEHAVVVVFRDGKIVGDHPLAAFLKGDALDLAQARLKRGEAFFDEAGYRAGRTYGGAFHFTAIKGVTLKRPPIHAGYVVFQGTVTVLGDSVFYVHVGKDAYAWFDAVDGEMLSTDVPTEVTPPGPKA